MTGVQKKTDAEQSDGAMEWATAATYIEKLGRIPPLFTAPIRALMLNEGTDAKGANLASEFLVMRLLRSPTFKSIFYFTAMTFRSEEILSLAYVSSYDLIRLYRPRDLAGFIGTIFTYRKVKSLVADAELPADLIDFEDIKKRIELAAHIGIAVPKLSILNSIHAAGLPLLAQGLLALNDPDGMREYKEHLKSRNLSFDSKYESEHWKTTSLHICARLLQQLGFGPAYASNFIQGMQAKPYSFADGKVDELRYACIDLWMTSLLETSAAPTVPILGHFYPLQKDLHKLLYEVSCLKEKGSKHNWLDKAKNEISPHATPQLYQEVLAELTRSDDVRQFMSANLPASLVDSLSDEEIAEIAGGRLEVDM
ncbi:MAG: hypothetical protein J0M12_11695 [Deltaproteobacteria bacterium]|nr:hypothetical protein [Deltaproteobacteria bacterium]